MRHLHGGNLAQAEKEFGVPADTLVDFSSNMNPLGPPETIFPILKDPLPTLTHFPDPFSSNLKEQISAQWRLPPSSVLVGNGSCEIIYLIGRLFAGAKVAILTPTFCEYKEATLASRCKIDFIPAIERDDFRWFLTDPHVISKLEKAELVFICNPNNPTGHSVERTLLLEVASKLARSRTFLVVDEAFADFSTSPESLSLMPEAALLKTVIILRSLTKLFSLPGLRIGYALGPLSLISKLQRLQPPWSVNGLAQHVAKTLLSDAEFVVRVHPILVTERNWFFQKLSEVSGVRPFPSEGNFILCRLDPSTGMTSSQVQERLVCRGFFVRNCDSFHGLPNGRFLRIGIRTRQDNEAFLDTFQEVLRGR